MRETDSYHLLPAAALIEGAEGNVPDDDEPLSCDTADVKMQGKKQKELTIATTMKLKFKMCLCTDIL